MILFAVLTCELKFGTKLLFLTSFCLTKYSRSTKINSGKIFNIFHREKKLFKISNTEIFISFALNQLNILIYSKTEILQKYTVKNFWNALNRENKFSWNISLRQKDNPTKYLKSLSVKIIFLGKDFILSFSFLFQRGFSRVLASLWKLF